MHNLMVLMAVAVSVYVLFSLLLFFFQGRLVFLVNMPGRALTARPSDIGLKFEDVAISTADGETLHGWFVPASEEAARIPNPGPCGFENHSPGPIGASPMVVLFFHGNAGNIGQRLDSLAIFHALGLGSLIFDYRGYGRSTGSPSERGTYQDAEAAWRYLTEERGIPPNRIMIFGRSLGGAVGAWLAARVNPAGVVIESCFTSGVDMARRLYPYMPVRLLTRLRYPVVDYVRGLHSPLLVAHSRDDEIVPLQMGRAIYEAAPEPKSFLELHGDHNQGFVQSCEDYVNGLKNFLGQVSFKQAA